MGHPQGPRVAHIPLWKRDRIIELYFHKKMMKKRIVERLNIPWSTLLRVIRAYDGEHAN